jgi:hypothetical protein
MRIQRVAFNISSLILMSCALCVVVVFSSPKTYLSGTWSDACPCKIPCSCWKTLRSSASLCVNFQVFKIEDGVYDGEDLAGVVFVVLNEPGASGEAPLPHTVFLPNLEKNKSAALEKAVNDLLNLRTARVVHSAIKHVLNHNEQKVEIPGILKYDIYVNGNYPSKDVSDHVYSWLSNPKQGHTKSVIYLPDGVKYSKTNALFARFKIPIPEK